MRKLFLILFIVSVFLVCTGSSFLNSNKAVISHRGVNASCDTSQMSETGTAVTHYPVAHAASYKYMATKLVYSGTTGQICTIRLYLYFTGTNAHTYYAALYSHDAVEDDPDSAVTNGVSGGQDLSGIGGSETTVDFTFSGGNPSLTNGTTYWVVFYSDTIDNDDYATWEFASDGVTEKVVHDADGSGEWTDQVSTRTGKYVLFSY